MVKLHVRVHLVAAVAQTGTLLLALVVTRRKDNIRPHHRITASPRLFLTTLLDRYGNIGDEAFLAANRDPC